MRYAIVKNGIAENVIEIDNPLGFIVDGDLLPCPDHISRGDRFSDVERPEIEIQADMAAVRRKAIAEIEVILMIVSARLSLAEERRQEVARACQRALAAVDGAMSRDEVMRIVSSLGVRAPRSLISAMESLE